MKNTITAILLFIFSTITTATHITVGTDSCDETTIQAAIFTAKFNANIDEIRVATNGTYNENIIIGNQNIIIRGGFADCASAVDENPASRSGQTTITGVLNANSPVIRITGDGALHSIVLDSLKLTGGTFNNSSNYSGGGISAYHSWSNIDIINSEISGNTGASGGGIAIIQGLGYTRTNITDTLIYANNAFIGGGVLCSGDLSSIVMDGISGVSSNHATQGKGGGIYLTDGCDLTNYSGTVGGGFDLRGIAFNTAVAQGGGIYADQASQITLYGHENCAGVSCIGDNTNPTNLTSNHSGSDGGGAFISGLNTRLEILAGLVSTNTADGDGGAIYVDSNAQFLTERLTSECWSQEHCNYYINNKAGTTSGKGGMIYNNISTVNISHAVIQGNRADTGTVIAAEDNPTISTLKSTIIHHNGDNGADGFSDNTVFSILSGAKIDISHTTIADNNINTAVFNIPSTSVGDSDFFASIIDEDINTPVFANNQSNNIFVTCMMLHETNSIPDSQLFTTVDDADFIDRLNGDYHLNPLSSPAIDYCNDNNSGNPSNYKDIDFQAYGLDNPIDNEFGTYDIGADEVYPTYTLTVTVTGAGTVFSSLAGIDCGISSSDCTQDYLSGTQVTLTATPNVLNTFDGWAGACTGNATTCLITMDQAKNTTATFSPSFYLLSATVTGNGSIVSNPTGIDCPGDCNNLFSANSSITLTATPDSGYVFVEWTGNCSGSNTCVLSMDGSKIARALFTPDISTFTLTTTVSGNGTITSSPNGINCGMDCAKDYVNNTSVTLTAAPMIGFNFTGWTGNCTGTSNCVVIMSEDKNVTATFSSTDELIFSSGFED